jgi:hypothetical protein
MLAFPNGYADDNGTDVFHEAAVAIANDKSISLV